MRPARPRASGFTLIELLVVIAIIALLAAILFPVFAQTREKARQSACLSNMKQIGTALAIYVQDHDGIYPPYNGTVIPAGRGVARSPGVLAAVLHPYLRNTGVWRCPSDANPVSDVFPARDGTVDDGGRSYFPNTELVGLGPGRVVSPQRLSLTGSGPAGEAELARPAELIALIEKVSGHPDPNCDFPVNVVSWKGETCTTFTAVAGEAPLFRRRTPEMARHHSGTVFAFADGHAAWMRLDHTISPPLRRNLWARLPDHPLNDPANLVSWESCR